MQPDITIWMQDYLQKLDSQFGSRIWFAGLQGSYGRGEATSSSDIDVVVILDNLVPSDLNVYSRMLDTLPCREKICGFISGKEELFSWEPFDLFQFYFDTVPFLGSLDELQKKITPKAAARAIHVGACNLYHMCAHNLVHEKSPEILKGLYKTSFFTLQAICYVQTGNYRTNRQQLLSVLAPAEKKILENGLYLKKQTRPDTQTFYQMSEDLLQWASKWITAAKKPNSTSPSFLTG